jgi:uncharacterized RDD family membrane protein YckC
VRLGVVIVAAALHYPPLMRRMNGRTIGKLVTGIRVVRTDGLAMSLSRAAWRQVSVLVVSPT